MTLSTIGHRHCERQFHNRCHKWCKTDHSLCLVEVGVLTIFGEFMYFIFGTISDLIIDTFPFCVLMDLGVSFGFHVLLVVFWNISCLILFGFIFKCQWWKINIYLNILNSLPTYKYCAKTLKLWKPPVLHS